MVYHVGHVLNLFVVAVGGCGVGGVIGTGGGETMIVVSTEGRGGGPTVTGGIPVGIPGSEDLAAVARVRVTTGVLLVVGIWVVDHGFGTVSTGADSRRGVQHRSAWGSESPLLVTVSVHQVGL